MKINIRRILSAFAVIAVASCRYLDVVPPEQPDIDDMMVDEANPALNDAQSLMSLFYRESFIAGDKGYASAIVVWTVLLIGIVTIFQFIGQKKWVNYEV